MESFEDLGVTPELIEALAAEGLETPTPLQETAVPLLRKGNNLILAAGPGSGLLAAWALGVLQRVDAEGESPKVLVLCATDEVADALAEPVARLTSATGHSVAALGSSWVLPSRAHVVFGTARAVLDAIKGSELSLADVDAVIVDQAQLIEVETGLGDVEAVFDYVPDGAQRVLTALPISPSITDLADRLFKRAMTLPAPEVGEVYKRGSVRFRIGPEPREATALGVVEELLSEGARHALVFCRNEDRAADVGDYFTLHGFTASAPGDEAAPVWLGVDALEARGSAKGAEGVVVVSCDAPTDSDTLDRRHAISENGVVIILARERPHLKDLGRRTGYDTVPFPPAARASGAIDQLRAVVEQAIEQEDITPYLLALEPLFERFDPAEVAAAAVALLRKKGNATSAEAAPQPQTSAARATATPSWAKLFVGVGERDGLKTGDLLGAITGETGVAGESVGKIDIRESHSLVEVHDSVARAVIQAINGTTIKGRAVRADFDRPRRGTPPPRRSGPRS